MLAQLLSDARTVITPAAERRRVAEHIRRAEGSARSASTRGLDPLTRLVRHLLLGELARYREGGVFPKNPGIEQTPIFVDASGVRCAMAHLLEVGGEGPLVGKIARERNFAYVRELTNEPRLMAWLAAAGLTATEAAAIQPSYCDTNSACVCGDGGFSYVPYPVPATGVLEGTVTTNGGGSGNAMVTIASIHGDGGSYTVGDSVAAYVGTAAEGASVLIPIGAPMGDGGNALAGVVLDAEGTYTCRSQAVGPRPVSAELFIAAVTSSDCAGTLAADDASWARDSCDGPGGGGCAVGGDAPSTLGILLAVVSVIAARRLARRAEREQS